MFCLNKEKLSKLYTKPGTNVIKVGVSNIIKRTYLRPTFSTFSTMSTTNHFDEV